MPLWGKEDAASNSVIWAPVRVNQTPNTANRDALYGNTTADAYITGQTVGMFAVDDNEIKVGKLALTGATVNGIGTGANSYAPGDVLSIENTGATYTQGAKVTVATTKVRTVAIVAGGTGYSNGDTLTCNTGVMTTNAVFTVTTGAADTIIASLALTTNGVFTTNPNTAAGAVLKKLTGSGSGATATVTMGIDSITISTPGEYSVAPTDVTNNDVVRDTGAGFGANLALTFSAASKGIPHTGWVLRSVGSGGRAGRVQHEVLVAGGVTTDNNNDDTIFPDS